MGEIIPHWLDKQASLHPEKTALEFPDGRKISFFNLQQAARRYAKRMAALGIQAGQHIGLLAGNSLDFVVALHGLSYLQAVAVLLNTRLTEPEIAYQLKDGNVAYLLADERFRDKAAKSIDIASRQVPLAVFTELPDVEKEEITLRAEINLDDAATIIYTSGTTGFPKGVCHTYGNHWWSAVSSALNLGLSADDKWLASLPFFHVSGLSILMKSLIYGMPVYVLEKFDAGTVKQSILKKGVTLISLVAVLLDQLLREMDAEGFPASFRGVLLGGGPASESLLKRALLQNLAVFQSYGMTETSSQIATLSPAQAIRKIGSAGMPLFPAQLKIMKDSQEQPSGTAGEIWVKGPMVSSGYYRNKKANQSAYQSGWLATGDLGYVDEEGFLYVLDRRSDLIISGGENIYPAEVEGILSGIDGVMEAGVTGKENAKWGQVPVAFLVTEKALAVDAVLEYCKDNLASYKVPTEIFFVKSLPRNASNKLIRRKLMELLEKPTE